MPFCLLMFVSADVITHLYSCGNETNQRQYTCKFMNRADYSYTKLSTDVIIDLTLYHGLISFYFPLCLVMLILSEVVETGWKCIRVFCYLPETLACVKPKEALSKWHNLFCVSCPLAGFLTGCRRKKTLRTQFNLECCCFSLCFLQMFL